MDEERNLVERGGGYVVLLIVTAVLFFGWRTGLVGGLGETEGKRPFPPPHHSPQIHSPLMPPTNNRPLILPPATCR
ncbi:MAG: hypothetical protein IPJ94_24145 [Chloroflexi bacterium]|nr:hypothetical protein [Chloroflexota bacterium]